MTRRIPIVRNGLLHEYPEEAPSIDAIAVESVTWYAWLECHRSFRFEHLASTFTARKEQRSGGWYWYAYRRQTGRLRTAYLGRSAELSATRLHVISAELAAGARPGSPAAHSHQQANVPTPEPVPPHNLPRQLTSLVGREQEVAAAGALLQRPEVRLLNMVGTAGVGKTRLALQVATDLLKSFADGVFFVALAPVRDPELVLSMVVQTLELRVVGDQSFLDRLKDYLQDQHCLLVLDNFEQVVTAAPLLVELLEGCSTLKLLVTSREVLHLRAEHQFPVPPLAFPKLDHLPEGDALEQYAAVDLFLQRAQAVRPDFSLTTANAPAVAGICARLDGLPLAIELAAARIKLLSPQALLARLSQRLQLLTGGMRDAPARQQTLHNTLAWSYELLITEEQRLFRRLSVFVGGCTLEAVAAMCAALDQGATIPVLEGVTSLLDKSLLQRAEQEDGEPRLWLLETMREYGQEYLAASGELQAIRDAHARYYFGLAQQAVPHLIGAEQARWFGCLEREYTNLRAALEWAVECEGEENGSLLEQALQLGGDLSEFWEIHYHERDGLHFLEQALAKDVPVAAAARAAALSVASMLARQLSDFARSEAFCYESMMLFRALGDQRGLARNLYNLGGIAWNQGNFAEGRAPLEEGLELAKAVGDTYLAALDLRALGAIAIEQGEYARAQLLCKESLALFKEMHNQEGVVMVLNDLAHLSLLTGEARTARILIEEYLTLARELNYGKMIGSGLRHLGWAALQQGDYARAHLHFEEAVAHYRKGGDQLRMARLLLHLADLAAVEGDDATAQRNYEESLGMFQREKSSHEIPACLEGMARTAVARGQAAWAARLLGAAQALRESFAKPIPPVERSNVKHSISATRTHLGEQAFTVLWEEGRIMSLEHILADQEPRPALTAPSSRTLTLAPTSYAKLTSRELEVLLLLAQGLTSAQIAERLVIGLVTVNSHVRSIYSKLGVTSRAAATRYAIEHQLV